jgi:Ca-activated chloride channel family protein
LTFEWAGPAAEGDLIFIARPDLDDGHYPLDEEQRHRVDEGSPARLVAPAAAGTYEIRYFSFKTGQVLTRQTLEVAAPVVTIEGPAQAVAGGVVDVVWTGPQAPGDIVFFAEPGWADNFVPLNQKYHHSTAAGSPAELEVPAKPGPYELRYFSDANAMALLRVPIEVVVAGATVKAPASVAAGAAFEVTYTGPQHERDVVFVAAADLDIGRYYPSGGLSSEARGASSASLVAPTEPGRYEVRYFSPDHGGLLARSAFEVTAAEVDIEAPRTAAAGSTIDVQIDGPGAPGDLVFIAERDWQPNQFPSSAEYRHEVARGSAATLPVPTRPDTYEIRYFSHGNGTTLARRTLVVR